MQKTIFIPTNVLIAIQNHCNDEYSGMKPKEKAKMIDATVITWDILYGIYTNSIPHESGYFGVNSQSDDLQSISVKVNYKRYGYTAFINILKKASLIIKNPKFSSGRFTKSYALKCEWSKLYKYKLNYVNYRATSEEQIESDRQVLLEKYPEHINLIDTLYKVNIDIEGMVKYLEANMGMKLKPKTRKTYYGRTEIDEDKVLDEEKIHRCICDAMKINNRKIFYTVEDRVYSSLSNLSSLCNDFIYVDGIEMKEVDVVNCQPLLLCTLVNDDKLKRVCERGQFYESLMEATGIEDRDKIKIECYKDLFFGKYKPNSILGKAFQELFPDAHRYLLNFEHDTDETLAKTLQIKEAEIFISVAIDLVNEFPVITKHDALFVPHNKVIKTRYELHKKFQEYGINPRFKII